MFAKRMFYALFFFITMMISCKKSSSDSNATQAITTQTNMSAQIQGIPSLGLAGTYSTGISLGDADFVVIRDCDPTGKQCKNDILTSDDDALGNTAMMDITFKDKDPNFIQTIACLAKSKITSSTNIDQDFPKDMMGAKHVVADFKINGTDYKCVVAEFAKSNLPAWVASNLNTSTSTQLGLATGSTVSGIAVPSNSNSNSGLSSSQITAIEASVGFAVGFLGGVAMVKGIDRLVDSKYYSLLKTNVVKSQAQFSDIVMTDFDGTLGLGDYDPHPDGYGDRGDQRLSKVADWEDFCQRKLGGKQGLKELRAKYPNIYADMSAADIVKKLKQNPTHVPELANLQDARTDTFDELVAKGHMVKLDGKYYNAPTWLEGAVDMLYGHIKVGRLVMFNSTNFRSNAASLIEASLAKRLRENGIDQSLLREDAGVNYRSEVSGGNPRSTKTQLRNVFIGTAAALGVTVQDGTKAGLEVRVQGDKAQIARVMFAEAMSEGITVAQGAHMISMDDKTSKASEYASFADDIGASHVFLLSEATRLQDHASAVEHITVASEIFTNVDFQRTKPGTYDWDIKMKKPKTMSIIDKFGSNSNIKSGLAGILMGAVLGGVGAVLGNTLSH